MSTIIIAVAMLLPTPVLTDAEQKESDLLWHLNCWPSDQVLDTTSTGVVTWRALCMA